MSKNSFGQSAVIFLVIIGILYVIGSVGEASEPKCIKTGCDNKQASGSSYCYLHKSSGSRYSSYRSSAYHSKYSESSSTGNSENTNRSYSNSTKKNGSGKRTYDSYDDGYDDIYMDGDYDYDRYDSDSDYADGVDDAMDETGEDW